MAFLSFASTTGEAVTIGCPIPSDLTWQLAGPRGWQVTGINLWNGWGYVESTQPRKAIEFKGQPTIEYGQIACRYLVQTSAGVVHYKLMSVLRDCKPETETLFSCKG